MMALKSPPASICTSFAFTMLIPSGKLAKSLYKYLTSSLSHDAHVLALGLPSMSHLFLFLLYSEG